MSTSSLPTPTSVILIEKEVFADVIKDHEIPLDYPLISVFVRDTGKIQERRCLYKDKGRE